MRPDRIIEQVLLQSIGGRQDVAQRRSIHLPSPTPKKLSPGSVRHCPDTLQLQRNILTFGGKVQSCDGHFPACFLLHNTTALQSSCAGRAPCHLSQFFFIHAAPHGTAQESSATKSFSFWTCLRTLNIYLIYFFTMNSPLRRRHCQSVLVSWCRHAAGHILQRVS